MPTEEEELAILTSVVTLLHIKQGRWTAISTMKKGGSIDKTIDTLNKYLDKFTKQKRNMRKHANEWNKNNIDRHKENNAKWYKANKERIAAKNKEYYENVIKPRRQKEKENE